MSKNWIQDAIKNPGALRKKTNTKKGKKISSKALNKVLKQTEGVMVIIQATHNCVSCRGVKHMGASMITSEVSGAFADHQKTAKQEVMHMIGYGLDAYR